MKASISAGAAFTFSIGPAGDGETVPLQNQPSTLGLPSAAARRALRRVLILANPRAGAGNSRVHVEELVDGLQSLGLEPIVCWKREEFSEWVAREEGTNVRCVVAAGGDGTLIETLNRAPGLPVALLPLGTENLMAQFWKIDRNGRSLAQIIARGACRVLDLARVLTEGDAAPGRMFCLMAGAGFDAEVVHRLHRRRHGHINRWTYAWPLVQTLRRYRYPLIDVEVLDTGERLRGAVAFVFNLPQYARGLPLVPEASGEDSLLNLCVFERPGFFNLVRYLIALLRGRRKHLRDIHHRLVRRVRLHAVETVRLQTDGDPAGRLPVTIEVVPAALTLLVPGEP